MIFSTRRNSQWLLSLTAAAFLLSGCSSNPDSFPQIANPPPFDFADGEQLRSSMHQLAFELQLLDNAVANEIDDVPNLRQEVIDRINNIERIAEYARDSDLSTRHPFLQDDMNRFLSNVRRAKADASRNNPRYYMAGRISGGCMSCHRANQ